MDSVFFLGDAERARCIHEMMQSYGCTYICLWSYVDLPSNCLRYKDGFYHERSSQPSSSSGTLSQRLFQEYSQSIIIVNGSFVPGLAFLTKNPLMELQSTELQKMASTELQRRFYQEARIKKALFMGCDTGEIEIGFSDNSSTSQVKEMEMRQLANDQNNKPASSSSSLRSLSYDSPEYSPMLFDPTASYLVPQAPQQQAIIRSLSQIRNVQLPSIESEDDAVTQAMIAVISSNNPCSSTSPSSLQSQLKQNLPPNYPISSGSQGSSAFRGYRSSSSASLAPNRQASSINRRQNMLKRSFAFLNTLYSMRTQGQAATAGRTSATQLHHMIAERRRREKLNESFQTLRSLLPPGTKKDKASVLASTTEYLKSLITQVAELMKRNQILEAQVLPVDKETTTTSTTNERVEVQLTNVAAASSSRARFADLRVNVRGDISLGDLVTRLLEFLKSDRNVNLISIEAGTGVNADTTPVNNVIMRLGIEYGEWDESAFRETIRRVVNDFVEKP